MLYRWQASSRPAAGAEQGARATVAGMTTTPDTPPIDTVDEARVEAFVEQFLTDLAGAATTVMTVVGDRLGLYPAMAGTGPVTAAELAAATGLHPRLVTEWLASQTVSGYLTHDPAAGTYELPAEIAMVLAETDSPAYLIGAAEIITGQYLTLAELEAAVRGDDGIDYDAFPNCLFHGVERFFRTAYTHEMASTWFPVVDGLVPRLEAGARVADVGCGHGQSSLQLAGHWSTCTVTGFDLHEPSIVTARAKAVEAGMDGRVSFHVADAADVGPGPSPWCCSPMRCTTWATPRPHCARPATCSPTAASSSPSSPGRWTASRTASATPRCASTTRSPPRCAPRARWPSPGRTGWAPRAAPPRGCGCWQRPDSAGPRSPPTPAPTSCSPRPSEARAGHRRPRWAVSSATRVR
ncbi:MAG: methyltransferase domain-containing protein [Pseudonocardiaceae bacterium]|nr:methyltransferase domain-containing protein [Pseudonocardiaceae bacterium]